MASSFWESHDMAPRGVTTRGRAGATPLDAARGSFTTFVTTVPIRTPTTNATTIAIKIGPANEPPIGGASTLVLISHLPF
jgi:hypothetical protein